MDGAGRDAFVSAGGVRVAGGSDRVLVVDDFLFRAVHIEAVRFAHGIVDQGRLGHKFLQFGHRASACSGLSLQKSWYSASSELCSIGL